MPAMGVGLWVTGACVSIVPATGVSESPSANNWPEHLGASNWRDQMSETTCQPRRWDQESETCVPVVPAPGPSAGVCKCYQG